MDDIRNTNGSACPNCKANFSMTVFSLLLLTPVAIFKVYRYYDFDILAGQAHPGTIYYLLTIQCAFGLAAIVWLGVAVRRNWGHFLKDLRSKLGIICVFLAAMSVLAWAYYLLTIPSSGMWYPH